MMASIGGAAKLAPALGPWFGLAALLAVLLKAWQPFRQMALARDDAEVKRLTDEVAVLRAECKETRAALDAQREAFDAKLEEERQRHAAEIQIMRHRLNNETQSLNALLLLLEANPARVVESVAAIKEMRAAAEMTLAVEKATLAGDRITGAKPAA